MTGAPYAEVIGHPIAHSLSPAIHRYWLEELGIEGHYEAVPVRLHELDEYLRNRRPDPDWRGCSVTAPLKEHVASLIDSLSPEARAIGAVNCISRDGDRLVGHNSDVNGLAAAIGQVELGGRIATIIGYGGAARAAIHFLVESKIGAIRILSRDPARHRDDEIQTNKSRIDFFAFSEAGTAMDGAAIVINASPAGMALAKPLPHSVMEAFRRVSAGAVALDMVYQPAVTPFLSSARRYGLEAVGGLPMLIGQARSAFTLLFGCPPPTHTDGELIRRLSRQN